jgi:hypothetical protein
MFNSRTNNLRLLRIIFLITLFLFIAIYALFRSLNYAKGPDIEINSPSNGSTISSPTVKIIGQAFRINKITLNGHNISIDESGNWEQVIIIFPGINKITVYAEDQFGRNISKKLDIIGATNQ